MEENRTMSIDFIKLAKFILTRLWIVLLCAAIGAAAMFAYSSKTTRVSYTASATMYVVSNNPNLVNYQYTSASDIDNAVRLIDTYSVVMKSDRVLDVVSERLSRRMSNAAIASTLSMTSVSKTGVVRISCTTGEPELSIEICNTVADVALAEIQRVVGAGEANVIDYAKGTSTIGRNRTKKMLTGALAGGALALALLALVFLLDGRIDDAPTVEAMTDAPLLAAVVRMDDVEGDRKKRRDNLHSRTAKYLIDEDAPAPILENYKQLRTNLYYTIKGKNSRVVIVSSAVPGEGKSTISANIAIVNAQNHRRTLLIDGDLRKPRQGFLFHIKGGTKAGLTNVLMGEKTFEEAVQRNVRDDLDLLTSGTIPPNPSEMLSLKEMAALLKRVNGEYDLIVIDTPPINVATDALVLEDVAGLVLIVRENFSERKELKKAFATIARTGMPLLGFIFSGQEISRHRYYYRHYYKRYYGNYYGGYGRYGYYGKYGRTPRPGETAENDETEETDETETSATRNDEHAEGNQ